MHPEQLRKLTRKWAIPIVLVTLLGAAASYLFSRHLTPIYAATGRVLVVAGPDASGGAGVISINSTEATTTAASLMTEASLLQQVITTLHLQTTPNNLANNVTAVAEINTELVDVTVDDPSPARAAQISNALMNAYVQQVSRTNAQGIKQAGAAIQDQINSVQATLNQEEAQLSAEEKSGQDTTAIRAAISAETSLLDQLNLSYSTFEAAQAQALDAVSVAEVAAAPDKPASPNVLLNSIAGGLAALLVASGFAYLREFLGQGLKNAEDVRERLGLACLGVIPKFRHIPGRGKAREPNNRHDEAVREAYRRLRINLLFATPDDNLRSVVITSVRAGEGKTCTAANLAVALAGSDRRVLLIDADLRKPDQHRLFGTSLEGGLSELILRTPVAASVALNGFKPTQFDKLSLLTSGTVPPNPSELLASKRAIALLKSIGPQEDLIVIDTAPAGLVTDPLSIAAGASATILIVEAGKTKAAQAAATIDTLREVGANVIGVVLNKASRRVGVGYYHQYGQTPYGQSTSPSHHEATAEDLVLPQDEPALTNPPRPVPAAGGVARATPTLR